ncbi:MAG: hypothetical protein ACP6IQ_06415 [Candidatus Njordarchaeia archaeon]
MRKKIRREKLKKIWTEIEALKRRIPPSPQKDFSVKSIQEDRKR